MAEHQKNHENETKLWDLWEELLEFFVSYLQSAKAGGITPKASMLAVIRSFLTDNGVSAANRKPQDLDDLLGDLSDMPNFDDDSHRYNTEDPRKEVKLRWIKKRL